jgi:antitoxin (DNA-binding transcriptional repressor) of toxin-antitoxin stability system
MKASILDLRRHMRQILKALDRNETVTLTYRGHEKATIIPKHTAGKTDAKAHCAFGLWQDRKEMEDVDGVARNIRKGRVNDF